MSDLGPKLESNNSLTVFASPLLRKLINTNFNFVDFFVKYIIDVVKSVYSTILLQIN